jgi:hypothetical protein
MSFRNLSAQAMFEKLALEHKPELTFAQWQGSDFESWKAETLPRVLATIGDLPEFVEPNPELIAEWEHDGLTKQRWLIDVGTYIAVSFQINYPADFDFSSGEKRPTLLCWSGHGAFGKDPVMGNTSTPELRAEISNVHYDYGHQMAKAGFITYSIDWMGMGERFEGNKPHWNPQAGGRDWCNLFYLHATMLGMTALGINITQGKAATTFATTLPGVDADRLGVMGISGGGTMTAWTALCDERFKAVEVICYSDLWAHFGIRDINYCGSQVAPGLFKLVDVPDLQGLIAPRPLLVDIGVHDECFKVETAMACFHQVEKIYEAAGIRDRLELDLFPGNHSWGGNKSVDFFSKYLR